MGTWRWLGMRGSFAYGAGSVRPIVGVYVDRDISMKCVEWTLCIEGLGRALSLSIDVPFRILRRVGWH